MSARIPPDSELAKELAIYEGVENRAADFQMIQDAIRYHQGRQLPQPSGSAASAPALPLPGPGGDSAGSLAPEQSNAQSKAVFRASLKAARMDQEAQRAVLSEHKQVGYRFEFYNIPTYLSPSLASPAREKGAVANLAKYPNRPAATSGIFLLVCFVLRGSNGAPSPTTT